MISYTVDLRGEFGPARDQGSRPTCMAFAASDAHALVHSRPAAELSAEYAHYSACTRMPSFLPHHGTSWQIMLDTLSGDGQPPECDWRYLPTLPPDLAQYKPPPVLSRLVRHGGERLNTLDEAETVLLTRWPVIFGLALSTSFYRLQSNAILKADGDREVVGRHAVLAVGMFSDGNEHGFVMRNSWGRKWGDMGYGLVSRDYVIERTVFLGVYRA